MLVIYNSVYIKKQNLIIFIISGDIATGKSSLIYTLYNILLYL